MSPQDPEDRFERVLVRLDAIEARLRAIEAGRTFRPAADLPDRVPIPLFARVKEEPLAFQPAPLNAPQPASSAFETRFGLSWLNRIGVLTVVLGVAFFLKYAIDNGLIGEGARVALGVVLGLAALALAELLARRGHRVYGQGITGAGISILYLALYSASSLYHLLPQLIVFALMFLTTAAAVVLSLHYDSIAIAVLGLLGGYLTPLLLSTYADRPWLLFGYIFVLGAGGFAVVRRKGWKRLEPLLLAGSSLVYLFLLVGRFGPGIEAVKTVYALALYGLFWAFGSQRVLITAQVLAMLAVVAAWPNMRPESLSINLLLGIAGLFAAERRKSPNIGAASFTIFWFAAAVTHMRRDWNFSIAGVAILTLALFVFLGYALWNVIRNRDNAETPPAFLAILGLDGLVYFGICYFVFEERYDAYLGLFAVVLAVIFLGVAGYLWKRLVPEEAVNAQPVPVFLSIGVSVALLTLAIPIQFSQYRITMSWAIEGALLTWIAARTSHRRFGISALVIFVLALVRLLCVDVFVTGATARLLTFLITGVSFWLSARWMEQRQPAGMLYLAGHTVVLWGLILGVLDWAGQASGDIASIRTLAVSVLLATYGVAMVILGVSFRVLVNRLIGLVLLSLVILKLYFYDVWLLQQTFRVAAFVGLGVLLLTASFLYSRFRSVIEKLWERGSGV